MTSGDTTGARVGDTADVMTGVTTGVSKAGATTVHLEWACARARTEWSAASIELQESGMKAARKLQKKPQVSIRQANQKPPKCYSEAPK